MNEALLTNNNRRKRNLAANGNCPLCDDVEEETIQHTFRDCDHAMQVWKNLVPRRDQATFFQSSFNDWMECNLHNKPHVNVVQSWSVLFGCACEVLWLRRNKKVFENEFLNVHTTMKMIWHKFREICDAVKNAGGLHAL
ncbi:hypothetical protein RIF29_14422 [Crotalaria pallida]|uniref:Reverse transcriptase zinc-binding domain-containing protein n=1 Tax=Crotalaria pallida TaxID=3830 RepID=A0AAN9FHJ8_CROPI